MQKGFAPILILVGVLVLAIVAIGAYYFSKSQISKPQSSSSPVATQTLQPTSAPSSTPDETANWKTYTNTKYGFSFKYPQNYFKYSSENPQFGFYLATTEGQGEGKGGPLGLDPKKDVWVDATVLPNNESTLEGFVKSMQQGSKEGDAQVEKINLDDEKGYEVTFNVPQGPNAVYSYQAVVIKNSNLYRINLFSFRKELLVSNKKLFNQIISTFKFLK